jgi:uncharacterized protein YllA (UPF0747 family)
MDSNNFYYRSSPWSDSLNKFIGKRTGNDGTLNDLNLLFPTTIINLGMKDYFYSEITFDSSTKGYIIPNIDSTSYGDTSDLVNLFESQSSFFSIQKAIEGKKQFPQISRDVLVEELRNQYKKLNLNIIDNQQVVSNIERLLLPNTYTVTTGQQLHPLLGPLYVLYKINDTLQYATLLKEVYPELTFIPVFWLASEDHDFDEVKNVNLFGKTFQWKSNESGAIGRFSPNGVVTLIEEILESVSLNEEQKGLLSDWKTCYAESQTMSEATTKMVHSVFGFDKVLVIDGDSKGFKKQLIPVIKKDILSSSNYKAFNQFSDKLKEQKFSLQLGAREINFFYLDNQLRSRIVKEGDFYSVLDTELKFSEAEIG